MGDLTGCVVQLKQEYFKDGLKAEDNLFLCECGFGCDPTKLGTKIFGHFISDNEKCYIRRYDIAKVVKKN